MTQQVNADQEAVKRRRVRGGHSKPFPTVKFERALLLPKSIAEHGFDGEIRRLTLFKELNRSPDSGPSQVLVTNTEKYGLAVRKQPGDFLSLTDSGRAALSTDGDSQEVLAIRFSLAIEQFGPFSTIYDKMKGKAFQEGPVLKDELVKAGVAEDDRDKATEVFAANLRFLGLIEDIGGRKYVKDIAEILDELPHSSVSVAPTSSDLEPPVAAVSEVRESGKIAAETKRPALHVDIQVHIDPTSSAEQIDQIFASMARHLYGNES